MKLVLLLILCFASLAFADTPTTSLAFESEHGEFVGQGKKYNLSLESYTFSMTTSASNGRPGSQKSEFLTIRFTSKTDSLDYWTVVVGTPPDGTLLQDQAYTDASRFGVWLEDRPHLDFFGQGRGVNKGGGHFTIKELTRDVKGNITSVAIDLVQYDDAGVHSLKASVRINSKVPIQPRKMEPQR